MAQVRIGVLALQGDVAEHCVALQQVGARPVLVRRPDELTKVAGLVIPGGESTTISRLADIFELREPIEHRIKQGMPVYGTCTGMIMLADSIVDGKADQRPFGGINMVIRRNAFGRQRDSFETNLDIAGLLAPMRAVFIRAPWVEQVGPQVDVLATVPSPSADGSAARIVAVAQGPLLATAFHPEVTSDYRMHQRFVDIVRTS